MHDADLLVVNTHHRSVCRPITTKLERKEYVDTIASCTVQLFMSWNHLVDRRK